MKLRDADGFSVTFNVSMQKKGGTVQYYRTSGSPFVIDADVAVGEEYLFHVSAVDHYGSVGELASWHTVPRIGKAVIIQ